MGDVVAKQKLKCQEEILAPLEITELFSGIE